jgi:hypothetical protein
MPIVATSAGVVVLNDLLAFNKHRGHKGLYFGLPA